ncbi:hypothetical protein [Microbacterium suwonense]|uniref:Uncharacterized protein n=1 Tax=Microbacterium suwonense TaxID=683047 RepID=A0ABN6X4U7_9MICO|nr:hypothetical protein [Microbacterium suwonense]BDZ39790.1 hypothetical protein GCM10025863_24040 [Microbacterium suwonense]
MKKSVSIVVTTALIATVLFGGGGSAMATDQAPAQAGVSETSRVVPDAQIIRAEGNHVEVVVSGELVVIDYFDGGAIISDANGQKTRIEAGAADGLTGQAARVSAVSASDSSSELAVLRSSAAVASSGSVACSFLVWVAGVIHAGGWAAAIAAVVALGPGAPAGAIVLATMYSLGVDAFLVWVGAQC